MVNSEKAKTEEEEAVQTTDAGEEQSNAQPDPSVHEEDKEGDKKAHATAAAAATAAIGAIARMHGPHDDAIEAGSNTAGSDHQSDHHHHHHHSGHSHHAHGHGHDAPFLTPSRKMASWLSSHFKSHDETEDKERSQHSTMPRSINPTPVWARQQPRDPSTSSTASPSASPPRRRETGTESQQPSDKTEGEAMQRPSQLHVADSLRARTAVATHQTQQDRRNGRFAEDRRSIDSASITTRDSDEDHTLSRFTTFTLPRRSQTRPPIPRSKQEEKAGSDGGQEIVKEESTDANSGWAAGIGGALTGVFTALGGGGRSSDSQTDEERGRDSTADAYDEEKQMDSSQEQTNGSANANGKTNGRPPMVGNGSFTRYQPLTPGWETPWRPESRGAHSINFDGFRFNNHGQGGYFPRTETGSRSKASRRRKRHGTYGIRSIFTQPSVLLEMDWWRTFLLHNAFVPLLFRLINIAFTASTLAIAIKLFMVLRQENAEDAVGNSPIVAIVFAPLSLIHVMVQIYTEYFSRPIGLWRMGSKLSYTLVELIFVCLWSAELSLAFDNYFTSTLVCVTFISPYAGHDEGPVFGQQQLKDPGRKPYICRLQGALIGLVFTSLLAYVVVFSVSLFRIIARVSKR